MVGFATVYIKPQKLTRPECNPKNPDKARSDNISLIYKVIMRLLIKRLMYYKNSVEIKSENTQNKRTRPIKFNDIFLSLANSMDSLST